MRGTIGLLLLTGLLLLNTGCGAKPGSAHESDWAFAYQNDRDGNPQGGNYDTLVTSIKNGADIKVVTCENADTFTAAVFTDIFVDGTNGRVVGVQFENHAVLDTYTNIWSVVNKRQSYRTDGVIAIQFDGKLQSGNDTSCMNWYYRY